MNKGPRILIVDDDPLNVKLVAAKLSHNQCQTFMAYGGQEALELVEADPPDLILLDVMMPDVDGYEVTRKLKSNPQTRDIPIIMITALDGVDDKVKGLEAGADEFLNKPVNTAELTARVKSFLRLKQYQEQLKTHCQTRNLFSSREEKGSCIQESLARPSILLVEDNDRDVRLIQGHLKGENYKMSLARNGEETISRVIGEKFDLIMLDILLPGMDGFEVCRRLKTVEATQDIQIVVITCLKDLDSRVRGLELGVDDFLVKPINSHELRARLKALLKKKQYLDRLHVNYETALHHAITDKRTGLYNHVYFEHVLGTEIERATRQQHPVSLLMIDIDDFKEYNDTLGHLVGDEILEEIGTLIRENIRAVDLGARYGGEEFTVVLPYTPAGRAALIAERIRQVIAEHSFRPEMSLPTKHLAVSIGIASYPAFAGSGKELLQKADDALYEAKKSGKNRVFCYGDATTGGEAKRA